MTYYPQGKNGEVLETEIMKDSLSVVIPAYNEKARIPDTLRRVSRYLKDRFREYEIIVVDDGSSDETGSVVEALSHELGHISLISYRANAGKGYAVRTGISSSKGNLLLICDADLSTPIEEYERLKLFLDQGFDIVIGSRGLQDSAILVRQPWYREHMGKLFNVAVRLLVVGGIRDTQCGFKLFRADVARSLFNNSFINGFAFDVEVLFLARKKGYSIKEVPIKWLNSPNSRVHIIADPLWMLLELFKIRAYWLSGMYDRSGIRSRTSDR